MVISDRRRREGTRAGGGATADVVGAALVLALAGWLAYSAAAQDADAGPALGALALAAAVYTLARGLALTHAAAVPLLVVAGAAAVAVGSWDVLYGRPLSAPFGYSNAAGGFFLVAAAAGVLLAVRSTNTALRVTGVTAAAAFLTVPWLNGTTTAAALSVLLLVPLAPRLRAAGVRAVAAVGAALVLATFAVTVGLAVGHQRLAPGGRVERAVEDTLSLRRPQLWADALALLSSEPLTGVGPGRFGVESPVASSDRDIPHAHHELLQLGAEGGAPALVLGFLLAGWAFARCWAGPGDRGTAVAAVMLVAVGVHGQVDYVLHFPAVVAAAAAVLGAGVTPPPPSASSG